MENYVLCVDWFATHSLPNPQLFTTPGRLGGLDGGLISDGYADIATTAQPLPATSWQIEPVDFVDKI